MKTISMLISLAAATAAHAAEDSATSGSIRASRSSTRGNVSVKYPVEKKKEKRVLNEKHAQMHKEAYDRTLTKKTAGKDDLKEEEKAEAGERELTGSNYKAKTGFSKLMEQDNAYRAGGRIFGRNEDKPGWYDDDWGDWGGNMRDDDRSGKPGNGDGGWMGGGGKAGKSSGGYPDMQDDWMGGGGKSGKSGGGSPEWGGSGKSGKSTGEGGHNGLCQVTVTNLSYRQAFSKMFIMLHDEYVTNYFPLYEFGRSPTQEMCDLTQNLNGNGLQSFYNGRPGVQRAWVTTEFFRFSALDEPSSKYLDGGATFKFLIRPTVDYLSLAAGFPFANDGGIVLQAAPIFNGAEYYLPAVDSGCEANLQTCWSVPANREDFENLAPRAQCADDDISDTNNNDVAGENFVSIHRGMQDLDKNEDDFTLLSLLECEDAESVGDDDNQRFAKYFRTEGYDDDLLLCATVGSNGLCGLRVDDDFLAFVKSNDDVANDGDVLIRLAKDSDDFDDFCDTISDINNNLESAFKVLEPIIFDFRNPIARVSIEC